MYRLNEFFFFFLSSHPTDIVTRPVIRDFAADDKAIEAKHLRATVFNENNNNITWTLYDGGFNGTKRFYYKTILFRAVR